MLKSKVKTVTFFVIVLLILTSGAIVQAAKKNSNEEVLSPTASYPSGEYYKEQKVTLESKTPDVKIYYTLDGSEPNESSTLYTEPVLINEDVTLRAITIKDDENEETSDDSDGKIQSEVVEFTYEFVNREEIANQFLEFTYDYMPYRLYIPENYNPSTSYPLVLFLHGGGERGQDNEKQLLGSDGAVIWAAPETQAKREAFVLAPQARDNYDGGFTVTRNNDNIVNLSKVFEFSKDLDTAYEILQQVLNEYHIDTNRIYSTGLSQGGYGTFNLNIAYPDLFAAMVPIAGGGDPEMVEVLKDKPIWAFHAEDDSVIPVEHTRDAIQAIKEAGGNPVYTEYSEELGYDHASWEAAYDNEEMIEWMFQQKKNGNGDTDGKEKGGIDEDEDGDENLVDDEKDQEDKKLPETATSNFKWILGGILILIAGAIGLFIRKIRSNQAK